MPSFHTIINAENLKVPLCVFDFSQHTELHRNCLPKYCVDQRSPICLTKKMQNYLELAKKLF